MVPEAQYFEHTEWDDVNLEHLARHGVAPSEAEQILVDQAVWRRNKKHESGEWMVVGRTRSGRALMVVVTWDQVRRSVRPVTARDLESHGITRWLEH